MYEIANTPDFSVINERLEKLTPEGTDLINELSNRVRKYKAAVKSRATV